MNDIEKLQQEHAIYKAFYNEMKDQEFNNLLLTNIKLKSAIATLHERLEHLTKDQFYWHPEWDHAADHLFILTKGPYTIQGFGGRTKEYFPTDNNSNNE